MLWQAQLDPKSLAEKARATPTQVEAAIARLGTMGLVGYDLSAGAYFHRELPFDLSRLEAMHPRLAGARKLLAQDGVQIVSRSADRAEALVAGSGVTHRVRLGGEGDRCTCPWFSKHRGSRGPCKHLLAAQLKLDEKS